MVYRKVSALNFARLHTAIDNGTNQRWNTTQQIEYSYGDISQPFSSRRALNHFHRPPFHRTLKHETLRDVDDELVWHG